MLRRNDFLARKLDVLFFLECAQTVLAAKIISPQHQKKKRGWEERKLSTAVCLTQTMPREKNYACCISCKRCVCTHRTSHQRQWSSRRESPARDFLLAGQPRRSRTAGRSDEQRSRLRRASNPPKADSRPRDTFSPFYGPRRRSHAWRRCTDRKEEIPRYTVGGFS